MKMRICIIVGIIILLAIIIIPSGESKILNNCTGDQSNTHLLVIASRNK